jgi:hypothetical protein
VNNLLTVAPDHAIPVPHEPTGYHLALIHQLRTIQDLAHVQEPAWRQRANSYNNG